MTNTVNRHTPSAFKAGFRRDEEGFLAELMTVASCHSVLRVGVFEPGTAATYAAAVVLRRWTAGEFVVHTAIRCDDRAPEGVRWTFERGDYCRSWEDALEVFAERNEESASRVRRRV